MWDGAQMAILATFLGPAFAASRQQHISDLHLKFTLRPHHVEVDIQSTAAEIRREKKERRRIKKSQGKNIMVCPIP